MNRLKELRTQRNFKQTVIAEKIGVTQERVRQIESKALLKFKNSWKVKNRLRDYA